MLVDPGFRDLIAQDSKNELIKEVQAYFKDLPPVYKAYPEFNSNITMGYKRNLQNRQEAAPPQQTAVSSEVDDTSYQKPSRSFP
jgi:hypothetical protein